MSKKQPTRGDATRSIIIEAALKLIGEIGVARLNHRAVAKAADVSLARTTYHFDSRTDIIKAAMERLAELDAIRFNQIVEKTGISSSTRESVLEEAFCVLVSDLGEYRQSTLVYLELGLEAARDADASEVFSILYNHRLLYFVELFKCAQLTSPEERAHIFMRCYIGLLLNEISTTDEIESTQELKGRLSAFLSLAETID